MVIEIVEPALQVPVFFEFALTSSAGLELIATFVSIVEVEVVPEVADSPLHSVPHVPTVVAFVKRV